MPRSNDTEYTTEQLLTQDGLRALAKSWTPNQVRLANILCRLPHDGGTMHRWGYVFAIDNLRTNPKGVAALLDVADEWDDRPTYEEMLSKAEQLLELRSEVWDVVLAYRKQRYAQKKKDKEQQAQPLRRGPKAGAKPSTQDNLPTPKYGFTRRK